MSVKILSNCFNSVIIVVFRKCTSDDINIRSYGHKRVSIDRKMYILIIFMLLNVQEAKNRITALSRISHSQAEIHTPRGKR